MNVKKIMLLVGALVIAAVTAIMAKNMFAGAGAEQAQAAAATPAVPVGPKVLVARKDLPVGTIIDAESLTFQPWPKEMVQSAYYAEGQPDSDMSKLLGTVVRFPTTAGQPMTRGALVGPNDRGFLAAALGPGMRAITVPVNSSTGVAGFVFPGDRVDIVLTQEVAGGGEGPPLKVSETVVRNVRVLATDQRTDSKGEDGKTLVKTFSNVTLEATPRIAEKVAVAQSIGQLSLSLRSIADNTSELERAIASGEVKVPEGTNPAQERQMLLAVANRPIDTNTTYSTGGDVSRFQRRSVPARAPASGGGQVSNAALAGGSQSAGVVTAGPVVRVARGNNVTVVPVGAR
jgi:pilus assembly protein CpaB